MLLCTGILYIKTNWCNSFLKINQLFSMIDLKPPISRAKMMSVTKSAIKAIKVNQTMSEFYCHSKEWLMQVVTLGWFDWVVFEWNTVITTKAMWHVICTLGFMICNRNWKNLFVLAISKTNISIFRAKIFDARQYDAYFNDYRNPVVHENFIIMIFHCSLVILSHY